ncbi:hypothetical protein HDV01_004927 [Terramyces sp. JEL0728]|nr:hypothetical protein HDV01_004927 [Terramyces sp. JEL0728]
MDDKSIKKEPKKGFEFSDFQYWSPPISKIELDLPEEAPAPSDFSKWKSSYPTLKAYRPGDAKNISKVQTKDAVQVPTPAAQVTEVPADLSATNSPQAATLPVQNNTATVINSTVQHHYRPETRVVNNYITVNSVNVAQPLPREEPRRPVVANVSSPPVNIIHNHTVVVSNNFQNNVRYANQSPNIHRIHDNDIQTPYNNRVEYRSQNISPPGLPKNGNDYQFAQIPRNVQSNTGKIYKGPAQITRPQGYTANIPPKNQSVDSTIVSSVGKISNEPKRETATVRSQIRQSSTRKEETRVELGNEDVSPSSMTLSSAVDENLQSHINEKTPWWRIIQVLRSIGFFIYTYVTVFRVLHAPEVSIVGATPLYISILVLSAVDVVSASIKAWPKRIWIFWNTENWDSIRYISSVWALIADHELLVDIIPLIANFIVRIYSYRLAELLVDANAVNTLGTPDTYYRTIKFQFSRLV